MKVVRHDAVRQTAYGSAILRLTKHLEKGSVVSRPIEEPQSADASIQDVKHDASRSDLSSIWHAINCHQDACQDPANI
jgi:hypothetical protein